MRRHAAVNSVCELQIILSKGLDERSSVYARGRPKRVMANDRIVRRNFRVRGDCDLFTIFLEPGKILLDQAHQPKVYQHQFHRRIADAFTKSICRGVDLMRPRGYCSKRIGDREST